MTVKYNKEIKEELEKIRKEALNLIENGFPERIKTLRDLLGTPEFFPHVGMPMIEQEFMDLETSGGVSTNAGNVDSDTLIEVRTGASSSISNNNNPNIGDLGNIGELDAGDLNELNDLSGDSSDNKPKDMEDGDDDDGTKILNCNGNIELSRDGKSNGEMLIVKIQDSKPKSEDLFPDDPKLKKLVDILDPHHKQIRKDFFLLSTWLQSMIPHQQDGNNFGVQVLTNVMTTINSYRDAAINYSHGYDYNHRNTRAQAVKRAMKHPEVSDYRKFVQEIDKLTIFKIRASCFGMYRNYLLAYDYLVKNIEKVLTPRTNNMEGMY